MDLMTANRLQQLRKENGYTQEVLAEKLGISRQSISKWERAEASPDTDNLLALAKIYGISVDQLLDTSADVTIINTDDKKKDVKGKMKSMLSKAKDFGMYPELAKKLVKFPFPILITIIYVAVSMIFKVWHPFWLIFMLIPMYYRFAVACKANNKRIFALLLPVPEIIVTIFLFIGLTVGYWSIIWILFLIIPIYYWACFMIKK